MNEKKKKQQSGMTLMETLAVILAGMILIAIAAKMFGTVSGSTKLVETEQNLLVMRTQIQHLFSGSSDYSGLDNNLAINAALAPKAFIKGSNLINSWGGTITLSSNTSEASFSISFASVPQEECTKLAVFQPEAWLSVTINSTEIAGGNVSETTSACSTTNTIMFTTR